jgi:hypothetical protein
VPPLAVIDISSRRKLDWSPRFVVLSGCCSEEKQVCRQACREKEKKTNNKDGKRRKNTSRIFDCFVAEGD